MHRIIDGWDRWFQAPNAVVSIEPAGQSGGRLGGCVLRPHRPVIFFGGRFLLRALWIAAVCEIDLHGAFDLEGYRTAE